MEIGIVNMYDSRYGCRYLINAITAMQYKPHVIDAHNDMEDVYKYIKASPIENWIFSGSARSVIARESPQIPLKITTLKNKNFMTLCYSMESILLHLGIPIHKRNLDIKEQFHLFITHDNTKLFNNIKNPMVARRHHKWYFIESELTKFVKPIASYNGELMIALYKNITLVQFHPEKTHDGKKIIANWIKS